MAIRVSPRLLQNQNLNRIRILNSSASAPIIGSVSQDNDAVILNSLLLTSSSSTSPSPTSLLNLEDDEKLFSSLSSFQLMRSSLNLHLAAFDPIVDLGIWVMKSRLLKSNIGNKLVLKVVKHSLYEHFCAGENLEEASRTLQKLWDDGLRGILDYGLEDAIDNQSCDRNLVEFLKTVDSIKLLPPSSVSFACVKITAICPIKLLEKVSDLLRWEVQDSSFHLPWKVDTLPILTPSSPLYHTLKRPDPLTTEEEQDLQLAHQRLNKLCEKCLENNVPLLVDAEYTLVEPAIDYLTYSAAIKFNMDNNVMVFGTIQAYLKDAKERIVQATEAAEKRGIPIGFKLVRGAYMSSESAIASSLGVAPPIHGTIKDTHNCYNDCTAFMLEKVAKRSAAVVLATHNLDSGRVAAAKAQSLGIGKGNQKLQFAQLKGMADALSFGLRNAGFQVSKYLPFGPVGKVMPYLLRRAEENRGLLSASTLDRQLMRKELERRFKTALAGNETEKMMTSVSH
ncbi:proline dehydrogenase 2, mitochondrial-like [Telopea speciosissima]|uniref:proline dehydrogenase 2, mitochondrial-like n=1 Tax=Telopea speciosissima TaxID=54955 RepID=UPI001CC7680A|nr:proline dehydrogenase 2, mitochondrial-like [Telopea speciosissima]